MKRWELIASWANQYGWHTGAEIGVRRAKNAVNILKLTRVSLILVEPWKIINFYKSAGYTQAHFDRNKKIALAALAPYKDRVTIIEDFSAEASQRVLLASLDFVFIDGDHSYEAVLEDIRLWKEKVRKDGWIIGHDWNLPDVKAAVEESFKNPTFVREDKVWYAVNS